MDFVVAAAEAGRRLDAYLAHQLPSRSRSRIKNLIESGAVSVDGAAVKPATRLRAGSRITVEFPEPAREELIAEAIPLDVVFEDEDLLVINKPPGLAVHPGAGRATGTLANALIARLPAVRGVGAPMRPGIVHRLDRDTSGLLVVAKTADALTALQRAVAVREVDRRYLALVHGALPQDEGTIEGAIGRHPRHRTRMAVVEGGRRAVTRYRVLERFAAATLVEARLVTGRTHQIRVHFAYLGHPVVGDRVYGGRRMLPSGPVVARQLLHAYRLALDHPHGGARLEFEASLPEDFAHALEQLRVPYERVRNIVRTGRPHGRVRSGRAEGSSAAARKPRPVRTRQTHRPDRGS